MRHHFVLSALVVLVAICGLAFLSGLPVAPFFVITVVAQTLVGLHLDDNRPLRVLKALEHAIKTDHNARLRHVH
jgi:hypothetical protein